MFPLRSSSQRAPVLGGGIHAPVRFSAVSCIAIAFKYGLQGPDASISRTSTAYRHRRSYLGLVSMRETSGNYNNARISLPSTAIEGTIRTGGCGNRTSSRPQRSPSINQGPSGLGPPMWPVDIRADIPKHIHAGMRENKTGQSKHMPQPGLFMAPPGRFERPTPALGERCSVP